VCGARVCVSMSVCVCVCDNHSHKTLQRRFFDDYVSLYVCVRVCVEVVSYIIFS